MAAAVEETKDVILHASEAVASAVTSVNHDVRYFLFGLFCGIVVMAISHYF
jgi:hypothetical protein